MFCSSVKIHIRWAELPEKKGGVTKNKDEVKTESLCHYTTVTHGESVRPAAGGQGQHPPSHVCRRIDESAATRSQRASLWLWVHLLKHAHTWHQLYQHAPFTWQHRLPACRQMPSPLTRLTAIAALQKTGIKLHRVSLQLRVWLLRGSLEYKRETKIKLGCRFLHARCLCFKFQTDKWANIYFIKRGLIADAGLCFCSYN